MHIHTFHAIISYNIKDVTITDLVLKYVESITSEQGIETLKIQGKNKVSMHPVDCILVKSVCSARDSG